MSDADEPDGGSEVASELPAPRDLAQLLDEVERDLIGEPKLTRGEIADETGMDRDDLRALWRSLGFAAVEDDDRHFTDADVEALRAVAELRDVGGFDDDLVRAMTRMIGQTFARLASWQGQLVVEVIGRSPELLTEDGGEHVPELVQNLAPLVGGLHDYVWRRQLAAYFRRVVANSGGQEGTSTDMGVGFVDMAGFTTLTRRSSEAELRDVLGSFERLATDVVGGHRGQVVKTIGDEVLYVADDPHDAAIIALELVEAAAADDVLPDLRAGVAFGAVVSRLGDVYGQTVNVASRLTSVARTGAVLVDENLARRLDGSPDLVLRSMRPVSVRGYKHLRPSRLRRAES